MSDLCEMKSTFQNRIMKNSSTLSEHYFMISSSSKKNASIKDKGKEAGSQVVFRGN